MESSKLWLLGTAATLVGAAAYFLLSDEQKPNPK